MTQDALTKAQGARRKTQGEESEGAIGRASDGATKGLRDEETKGLREEDGNLAQSAELRAQGEGQESEGATERLRDLETKGLRDEEGKQAQSSGHRAQSEGRWAKGEGQESEVATKGLRDLETEGLREEDGKLAQSAEHRAQEEEKTKDKSKKIKVGIPKKDIKSQFTNQNSQITNSDLQLTTHHSPLIDDKTKIKNLTDVINGLATRTPWRSTCLVKALAVHKMFIKRHIPHSIHFGMKKNDSGKYEAHAWVSTGGRVVIGGENAGEYGEVGVFRVGSRCEM